MLIFFSLNGLTMLIDEFLQVTFAESHQAANLAVGNPPLGDPEVERLRFHPQLGGGFCNG
ncbi:MAG: hypothetical protein ABSA70_07920 [Terriglobia bacterium]